MDGNNKTDAVSPDKSLSRSLVGLPGQYRSTIQSLKKFQWGNTDAGQVNPAYEEDKSDPGDDGNRTTDSEDDVDDDDNEDQYSNRSTDVGNLADLEGEEVTSPKVEWKDIEAIEQQEASQAKKRKEPSSWDIFKTIPQESVSEENLDFWNKVFVVTKVIICFFLFLIVLGSAVVTKISFLIVTSNIFPPDEKHNTSLRTAHYILTYKRRVTDVQWIWALIMMMGAPYLFNIFHCLWVILFQITKRRNVELPTLLFVTTIESLHTIGLNVFVYIVVPNTDPITGALLCLNVGLVPGLLKIRYPRQDENQSCWLVVTRIVTTVAAVLHAGGIGIWCYYIVDSNENDVNWTLLVCCALAPIFISLTWWENFVRHGKKQKMSSGLPWLARSVRRSRTKLTLLISVWKLVLNILIPIAIFGIGCSNGLGCIDVLFFKDRDKYLNSNIGKTLLTDSRQTPEHFGGTCNRYMPLAIAAISILSSGVCYKCAKIACKIMAQIVGMSLPLALSTPATIALVFGIYVKVIHTTSTGCDLQFPTAHLGATVFVDNLATYWKIIAAGLAGYMSLLLITNHVWSPGPERLQRTDKLFVLPLYCGILLDSSLLLNRRRNEEEAKTDSKKVKKTIPLPDIENINIDKKQQEAEVRSPFMTDDTPMLYLCATMWHETENEMAQILKSIFRMDEDQCTRRNYQTLFGRRDPDYYEFETHIFFDDAFQSHGEDEYEYKVNDYVKMLLDIIPNASSAVLGPAGTILPPTKIPTPYGGKLIWKLPGGNKMIAHLKDKAKIRHRKRWSQVMYMYYFLAHKLLNLPYKQKRLQKIADNTFILALDGDVDFQPKAVRLLIDRMRKNPNVGAACGRIHPIGNGAMVWYQKFEYAISHWLQKAAEDKLGCVLCSPGCFSLFRGSALMDDNVMNKYTTPPSEGRHYVQYDQGEDRWLCTLLLQQGHRVEYCAASDALTYAPEGFYEFFNQRRRWSPSTMANILDLLSDWSNVTKKNPDISLMYIFYQGLLMVSSILTPGTIFLLILGAINMAYPDVALWHAMLINLLPVAIFIMLCFLTSTDVQLTYAAILSTIYSLVMMIVLVGLLQNAASFGLCSVTTMFLLFIAGIFVLSAILHPQEFWCLVHGCLYFLAIPSMSMLLMLYSLGNLHVVSWGTRESSQPVVQPKPGEAKPSQPKGRVHEWLEKFGISGPSTETTSDFQFSLGNLFRCICCPQPVTQQTDMPMRAILERLDDIESKMTNNTIGSQGYVSGLSASPSGVADGQTSDTAAEAVAVPFSQADHLFEGAGHRDNPIFEEERQQPRDELTMPFWAEDKDLDNCPMDFLKDSEVEFWKEMIETYLFPLDKDKEKEKAIHAELIELRNKVCLIFILINCLFVTIVFVLQQVTAESGSLSITLPCATTDEAGQKIEPISVAFTLIFGVLLFAQFLCMLMHRVATLMHICAATDVLKPKMKMKPEGALNLAESGVGVPEEGISVEEGLSLIRDLQKPKDDDTMSVSTRASTIPSDDSDDVDLGKRRRSLAKERWKRITAASAKNEKKMNNMTLSRNFMKNLKTLQEHFSRTEETDQSDGPGEATEDEIGKLKAAQPKFKRFERKSLYTIVHLAKDKKMKEAVAQRSKQLTNKWKEIVLKQTKLHNGGSADGVDGEARKPSIADIVKIAVAKEKAKAGTSSLGAVQEDGTTLDEVQMKPKSSGMYRKRNMADILRIAVAKRKREEQEEKSSRDVLTKEENESGDDYGNIGATGPKLAVPKVEDDIWPDEDLYANTGTPQGSLRNADVLF